MLQWVLTGIGVTIIIGYSLFVLAGFIRGPRVALSTPTEARFSTTSPVLEIAGQALHTDILTINDSPLSLDLKGNFSERVLLGVGYNILSVKALDRYGRSSEQHMEVILVSDTPTPIATSTVTTTMEGDVDSDVSMDVIESTDMATGTISN